MFQFKRRGIPILDNDIWWLFGGLIFVVLLSFSSVIFHCVFFVGGVVGHLSCFFGLVSSGNGTSLAVVLPYYHPCVGCQNPPWLAVDCLFLPMAASLSTFEEISYHSTKYYTCTG